MNEHSVPSITSQINNMMVSGKADDGTYNNIKDVLSKRDIYLIVQCIKQKLNRVGS